MLQRRSCKKATLCMAGVQGFEPQLPDPESGVLPLDDTPKAPQKGRTPDSVRVRHLSLLRSRRQRVVCRLLPDLARAAAV